MADSTVLECSGGGDPHRIEVRGKNVARTRCLVHDEIFSIVFE